MSESVLSVTVNVPFLSVTVTSERERERNDCRGEIRPCSCGVILAGNSLLQIVEKVYLKRCPYMSTFA